MNLKTATLLIWVAVIILSIFQFIESRAVGSDSIIGLLLFPLMLIAIVLTTMSLMSYLKKDDVVAPQATPTPYTHSRKKRLITSYFASAVVSLFTFFILNTVPWLFGTVPDKEADKIHNAAQLISIMLFIILCVWTTQKNKPNTPN